MRSGMRWGRAALVILLVAIAVDVPLSEPANARTLTWGRASDAATLDPHAAYDAITTALVQQIYEPLLQRNAQGKLVAVLADSWTLSPDPKVWEFRLRKGVSFHDGSPLTADDVLFSIKRAQQPASQLRRVLASVVEVSKIDAGTITIKTAGPTPLLPGTLSRVLIMSKSWAERHGAQTVPTPPNRDSSHTFNHANGTGPFVLTHRQPGVVTTMDRNSTYWGRDQTSNAITQLIYRPISDPQQRVNALIEGKLDFLQDVPIDALDTLQENDAIDVVVGPENRSIFLGLNVSPAASANPTLKGRNPLADRRVREAINIAIDRRLIQREITRGNSIPTGSLVPPGVNGYTRALDKIPDHDLAKAKQLLEQAGLKDGFAINLDCPQNLYVKDKDICGSIAEQLSKIGLSITPAVRDGKVHLARVRSQPPGTDFFLLGLSVPSFDSESILRTLYHTRNDEAGHLNATHFSDPEIDRMTQSLANQTDFIARNETITLILELVHRKMIYIPLHIQTLAYAMKSDVSISVDIENLPKLKNAVVEPAQ